MQRCIPCIEAVNRWVNPLATAEQAFGGTTHPTQWGLACILTSHTQYKSIIFVLA